MSDQFDKDQAEAEFLTRLHSVFPVGTGEAANVLKQGVAEHIAGTLNMQLIDARRLVDAAFEYDPSGKVFYFVVALAQAGIEPDFIWRSIAIGHKAYIDASRNR